MIIAIGDVHGKIKSYEKIVNSFRSDYTHTVQVGDLGVGFRDVPLPVLGERDYYFAGNHDDAKICNKQPNCLGDFGWKMIDNRSCFFIRGADSIDKEFRIPGISWWDYEELSYSETDRAIDEYKSGIEGGKVPEIIFSHDCPQVIRDKYFGIKNVSFTSDLLDVILGIYAPRIWVFGHHHKSMNFEYRGTNFICLNELEKVIL